MADALCGPSNPLQSFQKHTSVDRTLQQDRHLGRQSPAEGFRSATRANVGALDQEFDAFEAGLYPPPISPHIQQTQNWGRVNFETPNSTPQVAEWASDFQRLQISNAPPPNAQYGPSSQASIQQTSYSTWHDDYLRQSSQLPPQIVLQPRIQQGYGGMANGRLRNQGMLGNGTNEPGFESVSVARWKQPQNEDDALFDEDAFERAFDAASSQLLHPESGVAQEEIVGFAQNQLDHGLDNGLAPTDHLLEQHRIGADTVPWQASEQQEERLQKDNQDELARTAGQLLESVKEEQSLKFRESNFLALMRRLRDKEVIVEGDQVVDHEASLKSFALSTSRDLPDGSSVSAALSHHLSHRPSKEQDIVYSALPIEPLISDAASSSSSSSSPPPSPRPPPFSSLYFPAEPDVDRYQLPVTDGDPVSHAAFAPAPPFEEASSSSAAAVAETKAALPADTKGEASSKSADDGEPPPPYTEGSSPLDSFTYVMAAAGGAASIITQVQQSGGPPINTLGDVGADENITLDLRGTRFTLSRDELLTLPEFVLLSLFPNGLLPDGHMNSFHEGDIYPVDYDPASLQYMLDFFRNVAQTIPSGSPSPTTSPEPDAVPIEPMPGSAKDMLQDRAGIIVLREDLDFYAIPPKADIEQPEMIEVKRAAARALLQQNGIFSGLRRSEETGTTEQHLIEMLTAGGFNNDDRWGHRAAEPNKAVVCSLALARLRTDIKGNDLANSNAVGMAQKLLLFWRKPARRCWWEGVELENVDGVEGKLKVWIRRVWTLEMSVIGLR